jgi:hypothetical protein
VSRQLCHLSYIAVSNQDVVTMGVTRLAQASYSEVLPCSYVTQSSPGLSPDTLSGDLSPQLPEWFAFSHYAVHYSFFQPQQHLCLSVKHLQAINNKCYLLAVVETVEPPLSVPEHNPLEDLLNEELLQVRPRKPSTRQYSKIETKIASSTTPKRAHVSTVWYNRSPFTSILHSAL